MKIRRIGGMRETEMIWDKEAVERNKQINDIGMRLAERGLKFYDSPFDVEDAQRQYAMLTDGQVREREYRDRRNAEAAKEQEAFESRIKALHPERYGNWDAALKKQQYDANRQRLAIQMRDDAEYMDNVIRLRDIDNGMRKDETVAFAIANAMKNGGKTTDGGVAAINRGLGTDGEKNGIKDAGFFGGDGRFNMTGIIKDPNGQNMYSLLVNDGLDAEAQLMYAYRYSDPTWTEESGREKPLFSNEMVSAIEDKYRKSREGSATKFLESDLQDVRNKALLMTKKLDERKAMFTDRINQYRNDRKEGFHNSNWHENVARINANSRENVADANNKTRIEISKQKYKQAIELGLRGEKLELVKSLLKQSDIMGAQNTTLEEAFAEVDKQYKDRKDNGREEPEKKGGSYFTPEQQASTNVATNVATTNNYRDFTPEQRKQAAEILARRENEAAKQRELQRKQIEERQNKDGGKQTLSLE